MFQSGFIDDEIERLVINSKHQLTNMTSHSLNTNTNTSAAGISPSPNSGAAGANVITSNINSNNTSSSSPMQSPTNATSSGGGGVSSAIGSASNTTTSGIIGGAAFSSPLQQQQQQQQQMMRDSVISGDGGSRPCALIAIAFKTTIRLWLVVDASVTHLIGNFGLSAPIDALFFIGPSLVATSNVGKIGVWNSLSQQWQTQDITPIASFDTAGSFLLLGGQNGVLYFIDMQKFPLRMKDNDLLVTELYKDPLGDSITALSVYLTPKTTQSGNWIEIAYGTNTGLLRVIVQHPETVGHGPQLFQVQNFSNN